MKELDKFTIQRLTELSAQENSPDVASLARIVLGVKNAIPIRKDFECEGCGFPYAHEPVSACDCGGKTFKEVTVYHNPMPVHEVKDKWVQCEERVPELGINDWRTALPVLVKCEIGIIPAYYGFTYHKGEQCFGFMESIKYGDASGSVPEQHENRLMMHVTHWMPLPEDPNQER